MSQTGGTLSGSYTGATTTPTEVGFYWSTTPGVNNTNSEKYAGMGSGLSGTFSATLASLSAATTYYYRAYVLENGIYRYGDEKSFTTASVATGQQIAFANSWLAHYEVPATDVPVISGNVSYSTVDEEYGDTDAYIFNTSDSNQRVVTHTFAYNDKTLANYTMLYDKSYRCALWEAWEINKTDYPNKSAGRNEDWAYDPALPTDWQPNLSSAYNSYTRGHQVASNDRQTTVSQNKQTFYYSNMTPQSSSLNSGAWNSLESAVQGLLANLGTDKKVYVVTGPIFESGYTTTTDKDGKSCPVPTKFYKCVLRLTFDSNGNVTKSEGAGYWFSHTGDTSRHTTTIDAIETMTGFDFYANVPESFESSAEAAVTNFF